MGKHETGYARVERDLYPTPAWVIAALAEHLELRGLTVWEPACGDGRMVEALRAAGSAHVYGSDVIDRRGGQDASSTELNEWRSSKPCGPSSKQPIERCSATCIVAI